MIDLQKARLATYPVRIEMSTLFLHLYASMSKKRSEKETAIMFAVNSNDRYNLASKSIYPRAATNLNSALEVIDVTAKTSLSEKWRRKSMIGTMSNPCGKGGFNKPSCSHTSLPHSPDSQVCWEATERHILSEVQAGNSVYFVLSFPPSIHPLES